MIRELDFKEVNLMKRGWDQNICLRLRVKSKTELFEPANLELLKKAILKTMESETFLSARIVKTGEFKYHYERWDMSKYAFENVKFLRLSRRSSAPQDIEVMSNLITDYNLAHEINPDKDDNVLLWRLYFFEVDRDQHVYDMIGHFHHSVTQGITTMLVMGKFLSVFQMLHMNMSFELEKNDMFPGCDNMFEFKRIFERTQPLEPIKRPSFIDPERARASSLKQTPHLKDIGLDDEVVCVDTNSRFESVSNLAEISRHNFIKYKVWTIGNQFFCF